MKTSLIHRLLIVLIGAVISFSPSAFGQDTTDMLSKSLDLVHQVESPTGNPPTDAQRIDLLTQAITMAQQAPNHRLKGHRVLAIQAIRSAIAEIRAGDPNHQAATYLHTADTELSTSVSLAGTAESPGQLGDASVSSPSVPSPSAAPPSTPSPMDGTSPQEVITRLVANASKKPLGPVENDVTEQTVSTATAALKSSPPAGGGSLRDSIVSEFIEFTLEGPLTSLYSDGSAALFYGTVKLTDDELANHDDVSDDASFGDCGGYTSWIGSKTKDDAHVIATFCLMKQHGLWKVHAVYLSNDVLGGSDKAYIVRQLTALAKSVPYKGPSTNTTVATPPASISTAPASLEVAARAGNLDKVEALLQANPNLVFSTGDGEFTPLVAAAWSDHRDVVEFLLANHADINAQDSLHMTALSHAATEGHKEMAEFLLANKADPNIGDNSGLTPLFQASLMGRKEMVELLLAHGADVNAKGKDGSFWAGDTPLYIAACNGAAEVAKVLLAHGADVNAKGHDGLTPLEIAIKNHHDTAEVPENDVADLLRPPAKESPGNAMASVPPEVTPEMEQAFLAKYQAGLKKQDLDVLFSLFATDPNMNSKAKESFKGMFLLSLAIITSNPDRTYSFVPLPSGQKDEPTQLNGKMYDAYLPAVVGLKITFGKPDHSPSATEPVATGDSTIPLCVQDHHLMMIGLKEIPGAVPPPAVEKSANFGIEPNLRKLSDKGKWEDRDAFTSLDEFLASLKQPSVEILDSGEGKFEYYAICRIAPNLCVWAGGDKVGEGNYSFYFRAIDSNKQELKGSQKWIRLVDVPTDNGQAPNVQGTVFFVPDHYTGPITIDPHYLDDAGNKASSVSRTIDWK